MNNENTLIPKYRFPEFKDDGSWEIALLDDVCQIIKGEQLNKSNLTIEGIFPCQNGGVEPSGYTDKFNTTANTITISEGGNSCGFVNYITTNFWLGGHCYKLLLTDEIDDKFLYHNLKYNENDIMKLRVGSGLPNIQLKTLRNFPVVITESSAEQQKIAACLSSLDDVIAGHEEKLTALEEHKKGLMQNLFPQEGETQPKYRFPEFENDGDWVEKKLSEIGVLVNGLTYSPNDVSTEGILVLRSSNVQNSTISLEDNVYVNKTINEVNPIKLGDILICVRNGSKSLIGKNALIRKDMPNATHGAFMTVFRSQQFEFVYQLFQSDLFFKQVHTDLGATINSINGRNLLNYKFVITKNPLEQQKIASVLSSVDELIVAQREKIEALKEHKKGLMQGLFPKIES